MTSLSYRVQNHGTIFLVIPESDDARLLLEELVEPEAQWLGDRLAVEHRYIGALVEGLREQGADVS